MSVATPIGSPAPDELPADNPSADKASSDDLSSDEALSDLARVLPFASVGSGPKPTSKRLERAAQIVQDAVASSDTPSE